MDQELVGTVTYAPVYTPDGSSFLQEMMS